MATLSIALAYRDLGNGQYDVPTGGAKVYSDAAGKAAAVAELTALRAREGDLGIITMDGAAFSVVKPPPDANADVFIGANLKDTLALIRGLSGLGTPAATTGQAMAQQAVDAYLAAGN